MSDSSGLKQVELDVVMAYENPDVIERYLVDHGGDPAHAKVLFDDVKRWLWMCAEAKRETAAGLEVPTPTIFDEQGALDDMWHTFILFTPAYVAFCFENFGTYLHHEPTPERIKREYEAAPAQTRLEGMQERAALRRRVALYTFEKLGPDVARRWYLSPQATEEAA